MESVKRIFLVDDNDDIREIYRLRFEVSGFEVVTSKDGLDCIAKLSENTPDIILLDIMMPEMDGYEVLKAIRQNFDPEKFKTVKVVIWSNLSGEDDLKKAMDLGASYYLRKSDYEGDDLVTKVLELMKK